MTDAGVRQDAGSAGAVYDEIGRTYASTRRADARIQAAIWAALAVLTVHHWSDPWRGVREMRRIARRVVIFTWDPSFADRFWFVRDYLPESVAFDRARMPPIARVCEWMDGADVTAVAVPHDCTDGFFCAHAWRRPEAYLDPIVRAGASNLAQLGAPVDRAVATLREDLRTGVWHERNRALLGLDEIDLGYRLLTTREDRAPA